MTVYVLRLGPRIEAVYATRELAEQRIQQQPEHLQPRLRIDTYKVLGADK